MSAYGCTFPSNTDRSTHLSYSCVTHELLASSYSNKMYTNSNNIDFASFFSSSNILPMLKSVGVGDEVRESLVVN